MKKKYLMLILTLVIAFTELSLTLFKNDASEMLIKNEKRKLNNNQNDMIAIMIKTDNGYEKYTKNDFPKKGYKLNSELSKCANGNKINYDSKTYQITITGTNADKCYLYFDVSDAYDALCEDNTLTCIVSKRFEGNSIKNVKNTMYYHDGSMRGISYDEGELYINDKYISLYDNINDVVIRNDIYPQYDIYNYYLIYNQEEEYYLFELATKQAYIDGYIDSLKVPIDTNDLSYRFSGDNPDNYVCLGNVDAQGKCLNDDGQVGDDNLYRIIGLFKNEKGNYETKLIKSEYVTSVELGLGSEEIYDLDDSYLSEEKRVKNSNVELFSWYKDGIEYNNWNLSPIKEKLNTTFLENRLSKYKDKIADTKWFIGGMDNYILDLPNQLTIYQYELGDKRLNASDQNAMCTNETGEAVNCTDELLYTTPTKIGLMYISDYTYASLDFIWDMPYFMGTSHDGYTTEYRNNNWLLNNVSEWTITRDSGTNICYFEIEGQVFYGGCSSDDRAGIRPTFYLNSNVEYASGDGSYNKPYTIA